LKKDESIAFSKSLKMRSELSESPHTIDMVGNENDEDDFFKHVMNDIEDFLWTNKINKLEFLKMKSMIEKEEVSGIAALFAVK
jgi:hypothetical protein